MQRKGLLKAAAVVLAAAVVGGGASGALAQEARGGPGAGAGLPRLPQLARQFGLTAEQRTLAQQILQEAQEQMQALHSDVSLTREQRVEKMQEIQEQARNNIHSILTEEQQRRAEGLDQQAQLRMQQMRQQAEDRRLGAMVWQFDLAEDQRWQLRRLTVERNEKIAALQRDRTLSRDEQAAKVGEVHREYVESLSNILTAEQMQRLEELRQSPEQRMQRQPQQQRPGTERGRGPDGGRAPGAR